MKTTKTTGEVSSPPEKEGYWSTRWRQNTPSIGQNRGEPGKKACISGRSEDNDEYRKKQFINATNYKSNGKFRLKIEFVMMYTPRPFQIIRSVLASIVFLVSALSEQLSYGQIAGVGGFNQTDINNMENVRGLINEAAELHLNGDNTVEQYKRQEADKKLEEYISGNSGFNRTTYLTMLETSDRTIAEHNLEPIMRQDGLGAVYVATPAMIARINADHLYVSMWCQQERQRRVVAAPQIVLPGHGAGLAITSLPGQGVGGVGPGQGAGGLQDTPSPSRESAKPMFKLTEFAKPLDKPTPQAKNTDALADAIFDPKPVQKPKIVNSQSKRSYADEIFGDAITPKSDGSKDTAPTKEKGGYREGHGVATETTDLTTAALASIYVKLILKNGMASDLEIVNNDPNHPVYISGLGTGSNQYDRGNGRTGQAIAPKTTVRIALSIYQNPQNPVKQLNYTYQYWDDSLPSGSTP